MIQPNKLFYFTVLICFIFLPVTLLNAQWAKVYGGDSDDALYSIIQTKQGYYIAAGLTYSYGAGEADFLVMKITKYGKIKWRRTYGGSSDDRALCVLPAKGGGFIIGGNTSSFGVGDTDFWIIKTSSTGKIQWQKSYGTAGSDYLYSMDVTLDGGYVVAGSTYSQGGNYVLILKLGAKGDIVWQKKYSSNQNLFAFSVKQTQDSGYIIGGQYKNNALIMKLDDQGEIDWKYKYPRKNNQYAYKVLETSDGAYFVGGQNDDNIWILKLTSTGKIVWQKTFDGGYGDGLYSLCLTSDGGALIAAVSESFGRQGSYKADNSDLVLIKLDPRGKIEWQKVYGGDCSNDFAMSIQETKDWSYIVAGITTSWGEGLWDTWILKVLPGGEINPLCAFIRDCTVKTKNTKAKLRSVTIKVEGSDIVPQKTKGKSKRIKGKIYSLGKNSTHILKLKCDRNGSTYPVPGTYNYPNGTEITIEAYGEGEYTTVNWEGHVRAYSGPNSMNIVMDGNKTIEVFFTNPDDDWAAAGGGGIGRIKITESRDAMAFVLSAVGILALFAMIIFLASHRPRNILQH
jgi:hypothetical protein